MKPHELALWILACVIAAIGSVFAAVPGTPTIIKVLDVVLVFFIFAYFWYTNRRAERHCWRCNGTGVVDFGNNDLPCPCPAGRTATFEVFEDGHTRRVTGVELEQIHHEETLARMANRRRP